MGGVVDAMPKGDVVLIKASRGEPGARRIWDDSADAPYVCLEAYWERWEQYGVEPICWTVGQDQLFEMDQSLLSQLQTAFEQANDRLEDLWSEAKPYEGAAR